MAVPSSITPLRRARKERLHGVLVARKRALREGLAGERHHAYPVTEAVGYELSGYLLGGRDAVGLEVAREHRARDIYRQHDIDTLCRAFDIVAHVSWARQCHDERRQRRQTQRDGHVPQPVAQRARSARGTRESI